VTTIETDDGQMVVRLAEIRAADPLTGGDKLSDLQHELDQALQSDTLAQYEAGLRNSAKVKVNSRAAELVVGQ